MGEVEPAHIEFEALGEAEVSRLVIARALDETTRAHAMRWLNDQAMARAAGADRGRDRALQAWEVQLGEARRTARAASAVSALALATAVAAAGLGAEALRRAHLDVRRAETLAEAVAATPPSPASPAPVAPASRPHRHTLAP